MTSQERILLGVEWKRVEPSVLLDESPSTDESESNNNSIVFVEQQQELEQEQTTTTTNAVTPNAAVNTNARLRTDDITANINDENVDRDKRRHVDVDFILKSPSSRYFHSCSLVNNETELFIFGGYGINSILNDTFLFNIQKEEWKKVEHAENVNVPERYGHSTVVYNHKVYVFGGKNSNGYLNDLMVFDCQKRIWDVVAIRPAGKKPNDSKINTLSGRAFHTAVVYRDCMYVFGGSDDDTIFNELIKINLQTGHWKQLSSIENYDGPSARDQHSAALYEDTMYIFGGISEDVLCDLWQYHIPTNKWTQVNGRASLSSFKPTERSGHVSGICGQNLIILAGEDPNTMKYYDDIYAFHIPNQEWIQVKQKSASNAMAHARAAFTQNKIFIFGGYNTQTGPTDDFCIGTVKPIQRQQQVQQQQQQLTAQKQ